MRSRPGFSLLELLVAMVLLDVAILCLLATSAVAAREIRVARLRAQAAELAVHRVESLSAGSCATAGHGAATHACGLEERWTVSPVQGGIRIVRDSIVLRGLGPGTTEAIVVEGVIRC